MAIYHASAPQIVAYAMPYVVSTFIVTDFFFGKTRQSVLLEIYESVQSVFLAPAVLSAIRHPHKPSFKGDARRASACRGAAELRSRSCSSRCCA